MNQLASTNPHPNSFNHPASFAHGQQHPLHNQAFSPPNGVNQSWPGHQPYGAALNAHPPGSDVAGRQSIPPPQRLSPNPTPRQQYPSSTPPVQVPMAAPQSPVNAQQAQQQQQADNSIMSATSAPQSPTTTGPSSREAARLALILDINTDLLTEITRLQSENQGGALNAQQAFQLKQAGQPDKMASEEYLLLLRRLQGNIAYLMPRMGQNMHADAKVLPGPAFMQHPPQMPQLANKYERLRALFPEWPGNDAKLMAMSAAGAGSPAQGANAAQQQNSMNGVGA